MDKIKDDNICKLVAGIKTGDRKAFDMLCVSRYPMLVSYAKLFLRDAFAEDVVQDVLFNVWKNRRTLREDSSLHTYLLKSVYNRCMNYISKEKNADNHVRYCSDIFMSSYSAMCSPEESPVIRKLFNDDLVKSLNAAIDSLSPRTREVFLLSYVEELSNKEIAERLGISLSTVENHMYLALKQLRSILSSQQIILFVAFLSAAA